VGDPLVFMAEATRLDLAERQLLVRLAPALEDQLRQRESELLAQAGAMVADRLRPLAAEVAELVGTAQVLRQASGIPSTTTYDARINALELVTAALGAESFLGDPARARAAGPPAERVRAVADAFSGGVMRSYR